MSERWHITILCLCLLFVMDILAHVNSAIDRKALHRMDATEQAQIDARAEIGNIALEALRRNNVLTPEEAQKIDALRKAAGYDRVK
jgi:hypothetical protein